MGENICAHQGPNPSNSLSIEYKALECLSFFYAEGMVNFCTIHLIVIFGCVEMPVHFDRFIRRTSLTGKPALYDRKGRLYAFTRLKKKEIKTHDTMQKLGKLLGK